MQISANWPVEVSAGLDALAVFNQTDCSMSTRDSRGMGRKRESTWEGHT